MNQFDILKIMTDNKMDIQEITEVVETIAIKKKGRITFETDRKVITDVLFKARYRVVMFVINEVQFQEIDESK